MNENIRRNLMKCRKNSNLTTEQLSLQIGIAQEEYEKMELGFTDISYDMLKKLATFYKLDISDLNSSSTPKLPDKEKQKIEKKKQVWCTPNMPIFMSALTFITFLFAITLTNFSYHKEFYSNHYTTTTTVFILILFVIMIILQVLLIKFSKIWVYLSELVSGIIAVILLTQLKFNYFYNAKIAAIIGLSIIILQILFTILYFLRNKYSKKYQ